MTTETVDEKIKELLAKPENRIKLHDYVYEETEKLFGVIGKLQVPTGNNEEVIVAARHWLTQAEEAASNLVKIFAYGCYFGDEAHSYLWQKTLERLSASHDSTEFQRKLELYPVMLVMYAGGVSAIAAHKGAALKSLLTSQTTSKFSQEKDLLSYEVNGWLIDQQTANVILELKNRTPISERVFEVLSKLYPPNLLKDSDLVNVFNKWDIVLSMTVAHHTSRDDARRLWVPVGRFAWHRDSLSNTQKDLDTQGIEWLALSIGLFDGDIDKAKEALKAAQEAARSI